MRDKLRIVNFKCFKEQEFILPNLTVLVGSNGMGKSSVIQSLLLIRNAREMHDYSDRIALNGPYGLELGTNVSVINQYAETNIIKFEMHNEQNELIVDITLEGSAEEAKLDMKASPLIIGTLDGIMDDEFYYLSAERTGPKVSQRMVPMDYLHTGIYGEHSGQLLAKRLQRIDEERRHPEVYTPYLIDHVNAWMKEIISGVEVTAVENTSMQTSQVKIRNRRSMDFVESTNIGFGISYSLPIIIQGLVAEENRYFIVENPEAHLHPSAQTGMGKFIAMLADKGLHVVIETHSDHLLDGIQIYAATHPEMKDNMIIYNFGLDDEQEIRVNPITLDDEFDYSEWPSGFMDQTNKNYTEFIENRKR